MHEDNTLARSTPNIHKAIDATTTGDLNTELHTRATLMQTIRSQIHARSWTPTQAVQALGPIAEHILRGDITKATSEQLHTIHQTLGAKPEIRGDSGILSDYDEWADLRADATRGLI